MSIAQRPLEDWEQPGQAGNEAGEESMVDPTAATAPPAASETATTPITAAVWGWLPILSILQAGGILLVSLANSGTLSSGALEPMLFSNLLYWAGLAVILIPAAMRLISVGVARQERVGLVISTGLALYLMKLIQSPFAFTYGDELLHLYNTNQILQTQTLFTPNSVLTISPFFPGLASVTAAISALTGLSVFHAGTIVIGVARLILVIGVFLFAEQLSRSPRIAGLTTLFFMCNSNFLYWSAQFAYESLAFPLMVGIFYLIARRDRAGRRSTYMAYTVLALLSIGAVVVTHHLSSYLMVAFLFGWWLLVRSGIHRHFAQTLNIVNMWRKGLLNTDELLELLGSHEKRVVFSQNKKIAPAEHNEWGPEGLALFAFIISLAWLTYVALTTYGYVSGILSRAGLSILDALTGSGAVRQLFASTDGYVVPLHEQVISLAGVALSLLGLPFGLQHFWQKFRHSAVAWMLATGAVAYFAMLLLRFTEAAWGTGNRASVYFYVGLAFILALAADQLWQERRGVVITTLSKHLGFALIFLTIFGSGVIAGWNPQIRFTQPLVVDAGGTVVEAQSMSASKWMRDTLGTNRRIITDEANGRFMLAHGEQQGYVGTFSYVYDILRTPTFSPFKLSVMQEWDLEYAVVDRRASAWDTMSGYFFDTVDDSGSVTAQWSEPAIYEKFDRQPLASRILDTGPLVIYDITDLVGTARRVVAGEEISPEVVEMLLAGNELSSESSDAATQE